MTSKSKNPSKGVFIAILLVVAGFIVSCNSRPSTVQKSVDLAGRYIPKNMSDQRMRASSELVLRDDGSCDLKDFPVVSYSSGKGDVFYYSNSGTWRLKRDMATWTMVVNLHSQDEIQLNILNSNPPYQIAQEGENVEDDILVFDKAQK